MNAPATPILLHIGSTKTGTSSLQEHFTDHTRTLAKRGVVYPVAGRNLPGQIAHHNLCYEVQPSRVAAGVYKPEVGTWSEALDEIDTSEASIGVISSEAFMNAQPRQVPRVRELLDGRDVTVVAYVRRQDRWLQSAWNQQARFGRCSLDFNEFYSSVRRRHRGEYDVLLAPWAAAFGTNRLAVRNFDTLPSGGIVPDFFATFLPAVTVAAESARARNSMAGPKQLIAVAHVLEECRRTLGPDYALAATSASRIAKFFRNRTGEDRRFSVLTYEMAVDVHQTFLASNGRLAELSDTFRDSGGFPEPREEEYRDHLALAEMGISDLDDEEQRFVTRMAREIIRAHGTEQPAPRPSATGARLRSLLRRIRYR